MIQPGRIRRCRGRDAAARRFARRVRRAGLPAQALPAPLLEESPSADRRKCAKAALRASSAVQPLPERVAAAVAGAEGEFSARCSNAARLLRPPSPAAYVAAAGTPRLQPRAAFSHAGIYPESYLFMMRRVSCPPNLPHQHHEMHLPHAHRSPDHAMITRQTVAEERLLKNNIEKLPLFDSHAA